MSTDLPRHLLHITYEEAADAYLRSLPPEHFMEATAQATQRKITVESLDLVHARRPDVQIFNELLVQYPVARQRQPGQVVPDNMVVVWPEPIKASGSYDLPLQPTGPLWVMEYVSKHSKRKDYEDSFQKYERHLKVLYYLVFYPDNQELTLFRHTGRKYVTSRPNEQGRYAIPQLEMEVGLVDGWVRYWYQGKMLPLPGDLQRALDEKVEELGETRQELGETRQELGETQQQLGETQQQLGETRQQLEEANRRADGADKARLAVEQELAQLRAQLEHMRTPPT